MNSHDSDTELPCVTKNLRIASPCNMAWDDMEGDERSRFCRKCKLNVHNISDMTRKESETFLRNMPGGRVCGRFYIRNDGTVMTKDCMAAVKVTRRKRLLAVSAAAVILGLARVITLAANASGTEDRWDRSILKNNVFDNTLDKLAHTFDLYDLCNCSFTMGVMIATPAPVTPQPPQSDSPN